MYKVKLISKDVFTIDEEEFKKFTHFLSNFLNKVPTYLLYSFREYGTGEEHFVNIHHIVYITNLIESDESN